MTARLRILQANLYKSSETQLSLLNDEGLQDFGLILVQEPHCCRVEDKIVTAPAHHAYWTPHVPTTHNPQGRWPFRSMIWAHRNLPVKPIPTPSPDITAVLMRVEDRQILVFSVYVPQRQEGPEDPLPGHLRCIQEVTARTQRDHGPQGVEIIVAGDFNRHDQLWGGDHVAQSRRQGEGQAIIELMADLGIHSLLPRGTITYGDALRQSTIDLMMVSDGLSDDVVRCEVYAEEHGSDHRAIQTSFNLLRPEMELRPRLLLRHAPWDRIRQAVSRRLVGWQHDIVDLDEYTDDFLNVVVEAVNTFTPRTRPSRYTKRWWTADLTQLRRNYTYWRNQARSHRRQGVRDDALEARATEIRREYHRSLRVQKKNHWDAFLEDGQNIWQAARYLQPDSTAAFAKIPRLKTGVGEDVN